ncbi:M1 family metallopeptidase [Blastomonas fulva]|uniref:M1 family metallopeptidase n=1 Tax=Blastomonas fulva TaxID=1550728 RepID=UPI003D2C5BE8
MILTLAAMPHLASAAPVDDAFAPLGSLIAPPDARRTATGQPGPEYWQQRADYTIAATLNEAGHSVQGSATITYFNRSSEPIATLWLAAGETGEDPGALVNTARTLSTGADGKPALRSWEIAWSHARRAADARFVTSAVRSAAGKTMPFDQRDGIIRVTLAEPLLPGQSVRLSIDWQVTLGDFHHVAARTGHERFADGSSLFAVGHWYPRVLAFTDDNGWATEPFLGDGEFAAEFGDFDVTLTLPAGHVAAATGVLVNASDVLDAKQQARLAEARGSDEPVFIITPDEALANVTRAVEGTRTWRFKADNVRDFAWASSPAFAWDAARAGRPVRDAAETRAELEPRKRAAPNAVLAMSLYPYQAAGLWARRSTQLIRHTLDVYGRLALPYPYPVMTSVNAFSQSTGVEYPMLGFTGPRPVYDMATGTAQYGQTTRDLMAELIIHETGHSWFPMIVNSDERRFAWMDEGINTFLNHIAMLEWEDSPGALFGAPLDQGFAQALVAEPRRPLMTAADSSPGYFGATYFKTAGALMMLRENILGREIFDRAMADYTRRWAFKRPLPGDFFRSIEDSAGQKLGWFWRGWFFGTGYFDMGISDVTRFEGAPPLAAQGVPRTAVQSEPPPDALTLRGNRKAGTRFAAERDVTLQDYYSGPSAKRGTGGNRPPAPAQDPWMADTLAAARDASPFIYGITLTNTGGLLLPQVLRLGFADGSHADQAVPVEMWRLDSTRIIVPVYTAKQIVSVTLDPDKRTPDAQRTDNSFAGTIATSPVQPPRQDREDRGAMATDGVAVTREGTLVPQE